MKLRIIYVAPVSNDEINRLWGVRLDAPAVRNKVLGVCHALKLSGAAPVIVSTVVPSRVRQLFQPARVHKAGEIDVVEAFTFGRRVWKRLIVGLSLLVYAMRSIRSEDRVILYNFFPEYTLVALYLRLVGLPAIIDIEDAPRTDEDGLRGFSNRVSFSVLRRICASKYITASASIGRSLRLEEFLPVYGVSSYLAANYETKRGFVQEDVRVLFGGGIHPETGRELFLDAIKLLSKRETGARFEFVVSGRFDEDHLSKAAAKINRSATVSLSLRPNLPLDEYRALATSMDIGLSLKLSVSQIGVTTFPSKIIEIAAMGMLVCATAVGDVPLLFNAKNAIVLKSEDPAELASALVWAATHRDDARRLAAEGRKTVLRDCSSEVVGRKVIDFVFE